MIDVPTDNSVWQQAGRLLWNIDQAGMPIPLTDALIACCHGGSRQRC